MMIRVNGQEHAVPEETTVQGLLEALGLGGRPVAVERNGEVVPKARWEAERLAAGDRVEIVQFVGGG